MLRNRVIPCLLVQGRSLVKTKQFHNPRYIGDPLNAVKIFNEKEVDELVLLDISATSENRDPDFEFISEFASECFMPVTYGGGIKNVEQVRRILKAGVEKVVLNSALHDSPEIITELSKTFGSQSIVSSIDVRGKTNGHYEVLVRNGSKIVSNDVICYAKKLERLGAGEILLTSIDREGTRAGYDLELLKAVTAQVDIPVIANGGAGTVDDFKRAVNVGGASAVAAGSIFVFHGKHQAVLINFPEWKDLENLFNT